MVQFGAINTREPRLDDRFIYLGAFPDTLRYKDEQATYGHPIMYILQDHRFYSDLSPFQQEEHKDL